MKLSKFQELTTLLEKKTVLQYFIDGASGSLYIGMTGVQNQIVLHRDLDMKIRVLLGIEVAKMEEALKEAGIDMNETPGDKTNESDSSGGSSEEANSASPGTEANEENSTG